MPAKFQRVMDRILAGLDFVRCYIDDIVVYSDTVEEHQIHLQIVFERLKAHGLRLHLGKCKFFQENVEYLGCRNPTLKECEDDTHTLEMGT